MLYVLDANVLITANNTYYPIDQVPEFWTWLQHQGKSGHVKLPVEMMEEVLAGHKEDDLLLDWIKDGTNSEALLLDEQVETALVQRVVYEGYANDLTDDELEAIGRDPFLIAYALAYGQRSVVTTEVSAPSKRRQNRRVPDVCATFDLPCHGPFHINRLLGFKTDWKP